MSQCTTLICLQSRLKIGKPRFHVPFDQRRNSPQAANPVVQTASYRIYFRANVYYETSMKETGLQLAHFCKIAASHSYSFPAAFFGCGRFRHLIPPHRRLALGRKKTFLLFRGNVLFATGKQPAYAVFIFVANLTPSTE